MELFWKNDKWNYKITMKGKDSHGKLVTKVYKTIDIIAADKSSDLRGRATRIYEAFDLENPDFKVMIKDSWVDVDCPKETDILSEILEDASDDEKEMFLTVLVHGVVTIDGREDHTQDLLMNGYIISTDDSDDDDSIDEREKFDNAIKELQEMMIAAGIDVHRARRVKDTAQADHIYKASIFEVLKVSNPGSQPPSLLTSPDVYTTIRSKRPPRVCGPKVHYRIVFKEGGQSLFRMSRLRQTKVPLVVQAMHDILKGSKILSDGASESF